MCSPHKLQCKIKGEINRIQIKILKISMVSYSYLIHPSKWHQVHKNPTIHLLDIKYGHHTLDTLIIGFHEIFSKSNYLQTQLNFIKAG